jgi:hypothetical protein
MKDTLAGPARHEDVSRELGVQSTLTPKFCLPAALLSLPFKDFPQESIIIHLFLSDEDSEYPFTGLSRRDFFTIGSECLNSLRLQ